MCSRIDISHVRDFVNNSSKLAHLINITHRSNSLIKNFTELLNLLPLLHTFWINIKIESRDSYLEEINVHEDNMNLFYKYGGNNIFTHSFVGD